MWWLQEEPLAIVGGIIVLLFYVVCCAVGRVFCALRHANTSRSSVEAPPSGRISEMPRATGTCGPLCMGMKNRSTWRRASVALWPTRRKLYPIYFFVQGDPYKLFGLISWDRHLFGVDPDQEGAHIYVLGTDRLGRDLFSRIIYGGRISLTIGLIGVFMTLFFGATLGAISGYHGGPTDMFVQRTGEFMSAIPDIPLFMALAAVIPETWSPLLVYFMLTLILAFVRWGGPGAAGAGVGVVPARAGVRAGGAELWRQRPASSCSTT